MQSIMNKRKAHLNRTGLDGSDGSTYSKTLEGFVQTVTSLKSHSLAFEELGIDIAKLNMHAFANESRKEHGFAKHKQSGQYRHPTMQQYSRTKGVEEEELIKKLVNARTHTTQTPSKHTEQVTSLHFITRLFHLLKQLVAAMFQDFGSKHCPDHNNQKKAVHSSCKEEMPKRTVEA